MEAAQNQEVTLPVETWGEWFKSWSDTAVVTTSSVIAVIFKETNALVTGIHGATPWSSIPSGIVTILDHLVFLGVAVRS